MLDDDAVIEDSTLHWGVSFNTLRPLKGFPRLINVACQSEPCESYRRTGAMRKGEHHFLFQYTLRGEGFFDDGQRRRTVPTDHGFLCRHSDPSLCYGFPPGHDAPWTFLYVDFVGEAAEAMVPDLIRRWGHVFHLPRECPAIQALLALESHHREHTSALSMKSDPVDLLAPMGAKLVSDLLCALLQSVDIGEKEDADLALVSRAKTLIQARADQGLNVTELVKELEVSRAHFSRLFKTQTTFTPYQFIMRERIRRSCVLLKSGDRSFQDIAKDLGFKSYAHFSRAFKNIMNTTPRDFHRNGVIPSE